MLASRFSIAFSFFGDDPAPCEFSRISSTQAVRGVLLSVRLSNRAGGRNARARANEETRKIASIIAMTAIGNRLE
jgi:hypothetical protein